MAPLSIGSQTGGSVIRPASYCGVVGYKPTYGLISRNGVLKTSEKLDHIGVFGRTVEDVALLAKVLIKKDKFDNSSVYYSPTTPTPPHAFPAMSCHRSSFQPCVRAYMAALGRSRPPSAWTSLAKQRLLPAPTSIFLVWGQL